MQQVPSQFTASTPSHKHDTDNTNESDNNIWGGFSTNNTINDFESDNLSSLLANIDQDITSNTQIEDDIYNSLDLQENTSQDNKAKGITVNPTTISATVNNPEVIINTITENKSSIFEQQLQKSTATNRKRSSRTAKYNQTHDLDSIFEVPKTPIIETEIPATSQNISIVNNPASPDIKNIHTQHYLQDQDEFIPSYQQNASDLVLSQQNTNQTTTIQTQPVDTPWLKSNTEEIINQHFGQKYQFQPKDLVTQFKDFYQEDNSKASEKYVSPYISQAYARQQQIDQEDAARTANKTSSYLTASLIYLILAIIILVIYVILLV